MLSNALLKFAAGEKWQAYKKDACVFGTVNGYGITASTQEALTTFFVSIAGIAPEHLIELTTWLENTRFPLMLADYEMTDNFLAIRAKDTAFSGTASQMKRFLNILTEKLSALEVDPDCCAICGLPAEDKALYIGLFCHIHQDCIDREGTDFTNPGHEENRDETELIVLNASDDGVMAETDDAGHNEKPCASSGGAAAMPVSPDRLNALADTFKDEKTAFIRDLADLVAIPSIQGAPEDQAPFGAEPKRALLAFLEKADNMGFHTLNVDNVAGYAEMGSGDEMIACVCHLDVVPAGSGWDGDPFELTENDGILTGRGVIDDKGPALAALYAMKALSGDPDFTPKRRIRLIVGTNEETGSLGLARYRETEEIPAAGFTADASFPAIYAEKGIAGLKLTQKRREEDAIREASAGSASNMVPGSCTVILKNGNERSYKGKMAHASLPHLGVNAIASAMADLAETFTDGQTDAFVRFFNDILGKETDGDALGLAFRDESGATTVNAGILRISADEAELTLNIRYPVHFDLEGAKAHVAEILDPYGVKAEWLSNTPPLYLPKDSHLIRTLMDTYSELTGSKGGALAIGGGTYARSLPNICGYGPVFPGQQDVAHQANESVETATLLAGAAIYKEALKRLVNA